VTLDLLQKHVRDIGAKYPIRRDRTRRLFVEERAAAFHEKRDREYAIKSEISKHFGVPYAHVCFTGSSQLGFSIQKERLFQVGISDLDAACVDIALYGEAWENIVKTTRAFSDYTAFGSMSREKIDLFQRQILRRGMILIDFMPTSKLKQKWTQFLGTLSRQNSDLFGSITLAIYMSEYAFCWKQDSVLSLIMER
jgi:hypothetical protein